MSLFRFDAIVFDFDGVLVDSVDVKTRAFAKLYEAHGPEVVAQVTAYHLAHGGVSRFEKFRYFHKELLGCPLSRTEEEELGRRFGALVEEAVIAADWLPGALEFLESHHNSIALFVASGTPEDELIHILLRRAMSHYFLDIGGAPRRKGEILAGFGRKHGILTERMLMVGDAMTDLAGAREANADFVGIVHEDQNPFPTGTPVMNNLYGLQALIATPDSRCENTGR